MTAFASLLLAAGLVATPGTEVVIVLDNSASMAAGYTLNGKPFPANDPERAAVLGTLVVEGLARGTVDKVTVIQLPEGPNAAPVVANGPDAIRSVPYVGGTLFKKPLEEARRLLEASGRSGHLLVIFTDGQPQDFTALGEAPKVLGLDQHVDWDVIAIGLYADPVSKQAGEAFLSDLVRTPDNLVFLNDPRGVVPAFMRVYAHAMGSRPDSGTLSQGETKTIAVGKYVTEVMVAAASSQPGAAFDASVSGPKGKLAAAAQGDNGCPSSNALSNAQKICSPPRRHYQVFRSSNDPDQPSTWTLSLPTAPGTVEYGVIVRYDLIADLKVPAAVQAGEQVTLEARLVFRGNTFDDPTFFSADGFQVSGSVGSDPVTLTAAGGGLFKGNWQSKEPSGANPLQVSISFKNAWMEKRVSKPLRVDGFLDLTIRPQPATLDLGMWRGDRREIRHCSIIDLTGSLNADRVPVGCTPSSGPIGVKVTCQPLASAPGGASQPLKWEICAESEKCCGAAEAGQASVRFAGVNPHYAAGGVDVPLRFKVETTGFLRCWWIWIAGTAAVLFLIWFVVGWVRPYDFDENAAIKLASTEIGLRKATSMLLREAPRGRRGFYRNARTCVDGQGNLVGRPRDAALVVEAAPGGGSRIVVGGGVQRKDRMTGKWAPLTPEALAMGYEAQAIYRIGDLFIQFT